MMRPALAVLAAIVGGCGGAALPAGVTALPTDADGPLAALAPLREVIGDATIVGLGESAHGSAGYARLQRWIVQVLVEHDGFRTVMVELLSDEDAVHAAFATCAPDALRTALYHQGWKDYHPDRLALYAWLCAYNQAHPDDPVAVRTFDPQKPWEDARALRAQVAQIDPGRGAMVDAIAASCFGAGHADQLAWAFAPETTAYFKDQRLDPERHRACVDALDAIAAGLPDGDAANAVATLRAWQDKSFRFWSAPAEALAIREAQMAANLLWRWSSDRRGPQKTIVLAHNVHVGKTLVPPGTRSPEWNGLSTLGHRLTAALGDRYRAIALTGHRVDAIFDVSYPATTGDASLDLRLLALRRPFLLVRTAVPWIAARPWSLHDEDEPDGRRYDVARAFDALAFFAHSPGATMLPKPE